MSESDKNINSLDSELRALVGPDPAQSTLAVVLNHPREELAARAALSIRDAAQVPALMETLRRSPGAPLRNAVIRALGRLKAAPAYDVLVEHLTMPDSQLDAIEALADLGDRRAIQPLRSLLRQAAPGPAAARDDQACEARDLASDAICRLSGSTPPGR